ncbi:MAG: 4Fe-4S dicluster domain-containing protein [Erysipelotrichaceae bacterium]|nr:4Fe-4S dicluster domain-containing protein [Erysipelotrichaceae bacterium]
MFLDGSKKNECYGCESCVQVCPKNAIVMFEDDEGFRYPQIDENACINCGLCRKSCPYEVEITKYRSNKYVFGGYILDEATKFRSTSGGAFSAIAKAFCDENYVIFGAEANGIDVFHSYIEDVNELDKFGKSKYSQSKIGNSYKLAKRFLLDGKKVLFSGTPCQIAGLKAFLGKTPQDNLLTVEVVCEGVPSPLYIRKMQHKLEEKYNSQIDTIDYRCKGKSIFGHCKWDFEQQEITLKKNRGGVLKWDFQVMEITMGNKKVIRIDRWFNPFWSIWLRHLMSRPSCYQCKFAEQGRIADITLGDLWGVHIYCPELYGKNGGASLIVCNTDKGKKVFEEAKKNMYGHELDFEEALKYQSPLRKHIDDNPLRESFMYDLKSDTSYDEINKKWAKKPSFKLLWQKYVWGNRQKVALWNFFHRKEKTSD